MKALKKSKKENIINTLNAVKAAQRKEEIAKYGKTINHSNVVKNKKAYTRIQKHKVNH